MATTPHLTLKERIALLKRERGATIPIEEIGAVALQLLQSLDGDVSPGEIRARKEVSDLLTYLREARAEIANIRPSALTRHEIPAATDELDAVVKATEQATFTILNAAETLTAMASEVGPDQAAVLNGIVTQIYEASNFQDISGQRINKVVKTLRQIEARLTNLATALGVDAEPDAPEDAMAPDDPRRLLSGPQLPESASSQADIDALFDSL